LRQIKLGALVRDRWGEPGPARTPGSTPNGATLREAGTARGWTLVDDGSVSAFGGALAWALRHRLTELHVLVEADPADGDGRLAAGVIARRARAFRPAPAIWLVTGRHMDPATPAPATAPAPVPPEAEVMLDVLRAHGVDPVVEHGTAVGEVLGLEVARVVVDETGAHLEVGVGRHDREARRELRPGEPLGAALDDVVALVRQRRVPGAGRHPAATLATERWLRSVVLGRPDVVGARRLDPVPPIIARDDLRRSSPAAAAGIDVDGRPLVVVCSTGVDLDLVPTAADHQILDGRDAGVKLVMPEGDDYPVTRDLAGTMVAHAEVVTVSPGWAGLLG